MPTGDERLDVINCMVWGSEQRLVWCLRSTHSQGRRHRRCGGTTYPHFCGMYPAVGTTQFTLYTCGVLHATVFKLLMLK